MTAGAPRSAPAARLGPTSPEQTPTDEAGVVLAAQTGCLDAQSQLYQEYYPRLYQYGLSKLGDAPSAEDLASDVMVSVLESMPRYRLSGAPFAAWVFRIARNRVIDTSRRRKRHPTIPLMLDVAAEEQVPEMVAQRVAVGEVRRQVDRLSPGQRAALLLLYFGGYNTAATARLIGKSEGAVKSLRFRGLIALRRLACGDETAAASQITV